MFTENLDEQTLADCCAAYDFYGYEFVIENGHVTECINNYNKEDK